MNKNLVAILIIIVMGLSLFAIDIFAPGLPAMAKDLGVSESSAKQTISVFFLAFAFGQLIIGPMSDRFGRRKVLLWALCLLLLSTIACALSTSLDALLAARFVQALGACAGGVVGRAMLSEVFSNTDLIKVMSTVVMVKALAPAAAPIIGGFLVPAWGWNSTFWALAAITALVFLLVLRYLPETRDTSHAKDQPTLGLWAAYARLLRDRDFLRYSIAPALLNGGLVALVACSPFILITRFGISEHVYGLLQGSHIALFIIGATMSRRFAKASADDSVVESSISYVLMFYGAVAAALALFAGNGAGTWIVLLGTLGFCLVMGFTNPLLYAKGMASFEGNAGTGSSVQGFIYYGLGAVVGTLSNYFTTDSPKALFTILGVSATLAVASLFALRPRPVIA